MATFRLSLLSGARSLDDKVWDEPLSVLGTNNVWDTWFWRFDEDIATPTALTTRVGITMRVAIPQEFVAAPTFIIVWTSTILTNDVVWDVDYRNVTGNDSESLDQSGEDETLSVTDTAPSAAWERMETSVAATVGNFAAGDTLQVSLFCDGTDGSDTLIGERMLEDFLLQYTD